MRIEVLGPVRLRTDAGDPLEVPERKVRALLAALAVDHGTAVTADALIDRVWGASLPAHPQRVLHAKLSQLRGLLERAGTGGRHALVHTAGGYRLDPDVVGLDAAEFRALLTRDDGPRATVALLAEARSLWRGAAYGEFGDEPWLAAEVAALGEARLQAAELEAGALVAAGAADAALTVAEPLLAGHPTRERLVVAAMHASYLVGRQPEALRHYERLRTHLAEQLGVDPGAAAQERFQQILRQDPALQPTPLSAAAPGPATPGRPGDAERPRGNLARHHAPLVGRAAEVDALRALLTEHRLVTVVGIGGVGKTRLAGLAAERLPGDVPVWFVDLTVLGGHGAVVDADAIARLVSAVLDLRTTPESPIDRIAAALDGDGALVLLDNCEHVVDAAAAFATGLLERTRSVRVLATSREPLATPTEQRLPLAPLPPEPAVELFLARARAVDPGFEADDGALTTIAELCRRLDGLPLAIELAAGRTNALTPQDLLDRITDRLDLLARPGRGAPRRRQTLRGMLAWSWDLLDDAERTLLRRLAVHPVTWTLDAVESICGDGLRRAAVLPALAALVDRSLVGAVPTPHGMRYRLLETVHAFAAEQLAGSGERPAVARAHTAHFRMMADCAQHHLFGPQAAAWLRWMTDERDNLDLALDEALRTGDGAAAVVLTIPAFWFRWATGRTGDPAPTLRAVVACPGPRDDAHAHVVALLAALERGTDLRALRPAAAEDYAVPGAVPG